MRRRLLSAALATCACAAAAGPASAQSPAPLSPERTSAIAATLRAQVKLDELKDGRHDIERVRKTCAKLPDADVMLARYKALCESDADISAAIRRWTRCDSNTTCRRAAKSIALAYDDYLRRGKRWTRTVRTLVPDADCREALDIGTEERQGLFGHVRGWLLIKDGLKNFSLRQYDEGARRLRRTRGVPSTARSSAASSGTARQREPPERSYSAASCLSTYSRMPRWR